MTAPTNPSLLTRYLTELAAHPLRTKAITSSILAGLQEFTAQKLSGTKSTSPSSPVDKRVVQMALYGLLVSGPLNHVLYDTLNKVFAGKTGPKAKLLQLLASNLILSPIFNCVFGTYMNTMIKRKRIQAEKEAHGKKQ
ncbi:unnamed protein product [Umbelopsis vinacea]